MFQATRRRLALWYTVVTAILLLFLATGMYFYVRHTLVDRIDDTLKHIIEVVNRSLVIESIPPNQGRYRVDPLASFPSQGKSVEDDHIDLEWFDPQGNLVWSTLPESLDIPLHPHRQGETIRLSDDRLLRQITERVEIDHYVLGYLRVSHPWFEVTKPIRQLLLDLIVGICLMIASVAGIGWFLSGLAIQPVKESYQSLKQFTADASHELRNPIATIQTNVQMAIAYPQTGDQRLQVIERLTERLGNLVNDLLFLARSDSGIVQPIEQAVPLDALLMEVVEEQRLIADKQGICLSLSIVEPNQEDFSYSDEMFTMEGDWDQLARLFTNLISNALKHAFLPESEPKNVAVELEKSKRDRQSVLLVRVKDNGIGIPEAALSHIFDRFYRLDPARQNSATSGGTGLGLAIALAITLSHHGQISVESQIDRGTVFTVTLPKSHQREKKTEKSEA
ncbi:MAG: sensor histidine kinase [Microcystis panniformis]